RTPRSPLHDALPIYGSSKDVTLTGTSPLASTPAGEGEELTGVQDTKNDITTLYPRFSGDGFTAEDGALSQSVTVPAEGEVSTKRSEEHTSELQSRFD